MQESRHSQGYIVQLKGQIRRDGRQSAEGAEGLAGGEPKAEADVEDAIREAGRFGEGS